MKKRDFSKSRLTKLALMGMAAGLVVSGEAGADTSHFIPGNETNQQMAKGGCPQKCRPHADNTNNGRTRRYNGDYDNANGNYSQTNYNYSNGHDQNHDNGNNDQNHDNSDNQYQNHDNSNNNNNGKDRGSCGNHNNGKDRGSCGGSNGSYGYRL